MPASGERRSAVPMRFAWGVLVGLSLTLFVLSMPARYEELAEVGRRASSQLGPRDDLLLHFLSRGAYAPTVLSLEVVFVLALTLASVAMVWRNWSDWRPLFFSAVFVTYSVWVTPTLDALGLPPVLQTLADLMQAAGLLMAIHFFLLFPDGCFVPRWIRLNARVGCVLCGVGPFPQHAPEPYRPVRGVLWGVLDPDAAGVVRRVGGARGTLPPGGFTPAHPDEVGLAWTCVGSVDCFRLRTVRGKESSATNEPDLPTGVSPRSYPAGKSLRCGSSHPRDRPADRCLRWHPQELGEPGRD